MTDLDPGLVVGWWTLASAAAAWPDTQGSPEDSEDLRRVLAVAWEQVLDYGPLVRVDDQWVTWTPDQAVPERLREAQLLQAKAVWQAERAGVGDLIGVDGRTVRVHPMDWQVKNLARPDDGVPVIG